MLIILLNKTVSSPILEISKSIDLMLCLHKAFTRIRETSPDLDICYELLITLAGFLERIDYFNLVINDTCDENILTLIGNLFES